MEYVSTNVKAIRRWRNVAVLSLLMISPFAFWYVATPTVTVHYSTQATENLGIVWNTQHRIYRSGRGGLYPGETSMDFGHIFPDEAFFMELYWWGKRTGNHCVNITPQWPTTHIYLNANGDIDRGEDGGTDTDRLKPCTSDDAKS